MPLRSNELYVNSMVELTIDTKPIFDLDSDGFPFSVEKFIAARE